MIKAVFFVVAISFCWSLHAQDTSRVKFAPGTLVGKYYGTYDTSAKKPETPVDTRTATNLRIDEPGTRGPAAAALSNKKPLQVNQNYDPIEISGTRQVDQLTVDRPRQNGLQTSGISARKPLEVNQNYNPIEVSGTERVSQINIPAGQTAISNQQSIGRGGLHIERNTVSVPAIEQPQTSYRETRLGSSSPVYNTYRTNDDGAGAITTNTNKTAGRVALPSDTGILPAETDEATPFYRDTRLGSSSPMYDTYEKNDYGAGGVTTDQHKTASGSFFPPEGTQDLAAPPASQQTPGIYRDTRLGSSSDQYDTYRKNDYGAGAVTTNPNKSGGGTFFTPETPQQLAAPPPAQRTPDIRRDTRLGSSSEEYDTYRKNDYGAGAVTTNPNKSGGGFIPPSETAPPANERPAYQKPPKRPVGTNTRLGSSSPVYNTYRSNNNGAGSVTTNPNKAGGATLPVIQPMQPEQAPQDSIPVPDATRRNMQKRNN